MTSKMNDELRRKRVAELIKKGLLVSPDFLDNADAGIKPDKDVLVLSKEIAPLFSKDDKTLNWKEIDKVTALHEKGKASLPSIEDIDASKSEGGGKELDEVQIVSSYQMTPSKKSVEDFTGYFKTRYERVSRVLQSRQELQNLATISGLKNSMNPSNVSVIGMITERQETKNKHIMLTLEDTTGKLRVIFTKNRPEIHSEAKNLVDDEVIGINGAFRKEKDSDGVIFPNKIILPDIPQSDMKKSPVEEYVACMSDLHFGSKQFMPEEFKRFLSWTNLETGNSKQKEMAEKLRYILIAGDIVDGIGIYQNQQSELEMSDVKDQYEACAKALSEIPDHIKLVISPGNHDAVRMAEPQPPLTNEFAEPITKLKNALLVSNPATVKIGVKKDFPGFNCLLYHGYSFDYYVANVDSIRQNGGYDSADLIMSFLLKRRHLAPAHTSTLINPTPSRDALFIDPVPDFFVAGHIHRTSVSNYKSTTLINSSCWQSMTSFQERLGHNPQPARLPLVNLKTRKAAIINFGK